MHRFLGAYKAIALIMLNTLILMIGLELFSTGILAIVSIPAVKTRIEQLTGAPNDLMAYYNSSPYYAKQDWGSQYWNESFWDLKKEYHPYTIWRSPPYSGTTLNIDQSGKRLTPGSECVPNAYKVFMFGGSAMWGWGAPDWGTIPAFLQNQLREIRDEPVCVVNYGENAYVSTQNLIQLLLELGKGNVPDLVIFYDGVNEVLAASQSGVPSAHQNLSDIADRFQAPRSSLISWLLQRNTIRLVRRYTTFLQSPESANENSIDGSQLANAVTDTYLANLEMARSLAETYGFDLYFIWQPYILAGNKVLTTEEESMIEGLSWELRLDARLQNLFDLVYKEVKDTSDNNDDLYYLGNVFDEVNSQIWIDTWGHITPEGNLLVAGKLVDIIEDQQYEKEEAR